MTKPITVVLFVLMVAAQLAVPSSMIAKRELTLRNGGLYKIRCAPVDPYDAFRGKYVQLGVQLDGELSWTGKPLLTDQQVYVPIEKDEDGFAVATGITVTKPESGDFIKAKVSWNSAGVENTPLSYPFDRYYLEEEIALDAERAYRSATRDEEKPAYITVRIRSGFGVIEELYIADKPLRTYLEEDYNTVNAL
ncbi:MAG TPA: hypothetical protein EYN96_02115 [Candidatus Hydrogenedentes bacterium]|jgi:uncharacterized membrane-anchored protein|nr:hypothetical protein [Candidatus Hydrogenedentota bacterium]